MNASASSSSFQAEHVLQEIDSLLLTRLTQDPGLNRLVALLGQWLTECVARASQQPSILTAPAVTQPLGGGPEDALATGGVQTEKPPIVPTEPMVGDATPFKELAPLPATPAEIATLLARFGDLAVSPPVADLPAVSRSTPAVEAPRERVTSLEPLARRLALKSDACRWAIRRHDARVAGKDFEVVKDEYHDLRTRAGSVQPCYLWMISAESEYISREDWLQLQGCYQACAEVLDSAIAFPHAYQASPDLLLLLGESQSAIRAAMTACDAYPTWKDADQQNVFDWCRTEGEARRIYNPFLALDQLADPSLFGGVLARLGKIRTDLERKRETERQARRGLNTVHYHLGQLADGAGDSEHHWIRIADGVDEVLSSGAPPSMPALVEALLPLADEVPDSVADRPGIRRVMRYVDQRITAEERRDQQSAVPARAPSQEVLLVREALRGKRVVLIGGDRRPHAKALLEREFELQELDWQDSDEHQSITSFEAPIARPDTALVVVMIRWSSHSFEGVQEICEKYKKPFVRLPGGYNPAQVAYQIIAQVSGQLGL